MLPWMIGRAFEKLSEPSFIDMLGREVRLPSLIPGQTVPLSSFLLTAMNTRRRSASACRRRSAGNSPSTT